MNYYILKNAKFLIVVAILGFSAEGCSKQSAKANQSSQSNSGASSNWAERASTEIKSGFSNFTPIVSNLVNSNYGQDLANESAKMGEIFESNALFIATNSGATVISAEEFLKGLKVQGDLPGVSRDGHGELTVNVSTDTAIARYPYSLTFNLVLVGDSLTNHFLVIRSSADSAWRLQRAWRTDSDGKLVKEWPVNQR